jgi:hypothetical protein
MKGVRTINRAALVVRPREPYLRWAASLDEKTPEHANDLASSVSVYLVPEDPEGEEETPPLEDYFTRIFEHELEAWWTDPAQWPPRRGIATFLEWFDVVGDSMVIDLGRGPVRVEEL